MEESVDYRAVHWAPPTPYKWRYSRATRPPSLRIYEAHVGISSPEAKCASYRYTTHSVSVYLIAPYYRDIHVL